MLVMKAVLVPDLTGDRGVRHNKLDIQDVEDKYTITQLLVVLLNVHVVHMEVRLADCEVANRELISEVS